MKELIFTFLLFFAPPLVGLVIGYCLGKKSKQIKIIELEDFRKMDTPSQRAEKEASIVDTSDPLAVDLD